MRVKCGQFGFLKLASNYKEVQFKMAAYILQQAAQTSICASPFPRHTFLSETRTLRTVNQTGVWFSMRWKTLQQLQLKPLPWEVGGTESAEFRCCAYFNWHELIWLLPGSVYSLWVGKTRTSRALISFC